MSRFRLLGRVLEVSGAVLAAVVAAGCLGDSSEPVSLPARAEASANRLPPSQRDAAEALVRLEAAARDRDVSKLCESVYSFPRGPTPGCEKTMARLYPTEGGFSLAIRSIQVSPNGAIASARVVTLDETGGKQTSPDTTYKLTRQGRRWQVVFIT